MPLTNGERLGPYDNPNQPSPSTEINVVLNWFEELKRLVPVKR
jgi:hypothetical protein